MDTIVAPATARGKAGVAVIRVSGPNAWSVCRSIAGSVPEPRHARLMMLRDTSGDVLDHALVLTFEEGRSFTGEQSCEFQVHGSTAVVSAVLRACLSVEGVRTAEPGEFTRRAFIGGRMNLAEVEGLADLIEAETEIQRRQAMRVFDGSASKMVEKWRSKLLQALALIEASLDFADEDLPDALTGDVEREIESVLRDLRKQLSGKGAAESIRDGFEVAIVGRVNTGKSTLLNVLAGREAAITSERAGTTRDVIEVRMDIGGLPVTLIDTAGLRDTDDEVERIGIDRGVKRAGAADLRIFLRADPDEVIEGAKPDDVIRLSKADLWKLPGISSKTGFGLNELIAEVEHKLSSRASRSVVFSRERHFDKLFRAAQYLELALERLADTRLSWEFASEDVRGAIRCLDGIMGRIDVEDVLGQIFSTFCIGK